MKRLKRFIYTGKIGTDKEVEYLIPERNMSADEAVKLLDANPDIAFVELSNGHEVWRK